MWREWSEAVFEEARERDLHVLLLLTAEHCPRSAAARERVEALRGALQERYLCVHATREGDPEVDRRFRGAGWPSVVVLDADQRVVLQAPSTDDFEALIDGPEGDSSGAEARRPEAARPSRYRETIDAVAEMLVATSDPVWGGWGARQKFPHPDALHFLLVRWSRTGRDDELQVVLRTLRAAQEQPIHDALEGGFYRFSTEPDWSAPNYEKPLLSNAKRLLAYAEAHQALGDASFRATAEGVARWMASTLLRPETGAFGGTQDADSAYARLTTAAGRAAHGAPPIDPTIHADRNAWAAIALFKAGCVFDDATWTGMGTRTLDFLVARLFDERRGVSHYWNGTWNQPGDLRDQATVLRAIVEGIHYAGTNEHLPSAEAIAAWTLEHLGSDDGSFRRDPFSREQAIATRPADDLRWNAVMGEALLRLGVLTGEARWTERGTAALDAFLGAWRQHGFAAAGYARALDLLDQVPLHAVIVGRHGDDRTRALVKAALRPYVASRVVQALDPDRDADQLRRLGYGREGCAIPDAPTAIVEQAGRTYVVTEDPLRLPALMAGSER